VNVAAVGDDGEWAHVQWLQIVILCVVSASAYGVIHDQVTARVCVEYFTIGHPQIFGTKDPTLLGIGWGIVATWWAGLLIGVPLAVAARAGNPPKRTAGSLVRPILVLLGVMAFCAASAGVVGYMLARDGSVFLVGRIALRVPPERHAAFIGDLWAHSASYLVGFVGGIVLIASVWRSRKAPAETTRNDRERKP
jgi:hypothetical protein